MYVKNIEKIANKQDTFQCYSLNLAKFLNDNELVHIKRGFNTNTNKFYFIFVKTDKLCRLLEQWKNNNPNKIDTSPLS